jgi:hypothetical protein
MIIDYFYENHRIRTGREERGGASSNFRNFAAAMCINVSNNSAHVLITNCSYRNCMH